MFLLKSIIHRHGHQTLIRKMSTTASDAKISLAWADSKSGEFNRQVSSFRNRIPSEQFPAERNRYHLYVSYACPWGIYSF
jgi:glutathionyl-hydroquinone reductase